VIVNLKDDPDAAIRGVLWETRGPWLVLRNAAALNANMQPTKVDGEIVVHLDNLSFLQVLP
jgi:hypothetical protein